MAHICLVGFQVEAFPTGFPDDLTDIQVMFQQLLDSGNIRTAVSGGFQFVGNVGVGTNQ
ncbi:hypothetical protein [Methanosarcina horonobensis]|uniref:hypothetical protein n=1 Tax=Methanosarcina horonobensis TaxID=418008 RepID=UPI0022B87439|nr:hypothetical protein [Methanosarcina horonobensis]